MGSLFKLLRGARKLHDAAEDVAEIKETVEDVVEKVRDLPKVLEQEWSPGSRPGCGGLFLLHRDGAPVREYDGDLHTARCQAGDPLPPGWQRGDVWRQVDER